MRFTVRKTRRAYVLPATHWASPHHGSELPRMGERFRLRRDFDVSGFPKHAQAVLKGLKIYGMFMADNGSDWLMSIAPDRRSEGLETLVAREGLGLRGRGDGRAVGRRRVTSAMKLCAIGCGEHAASSHGPPRRAMQRGIRISSWPAAAISTPSGRCGTASASGSPAATRTPGRCWRRSVQTPWSSSCPKP
jgi:hypothetical protein